MPVSWVSLSYGDIIHIHLHCVDTVVEINPGAECREGIGDLDVVIGKASNAALVTRRHARWSL